MDHGDGTELPGNMDDDGIPGMPMVNPSCSIIFNSEMDNKSILFHLVSLLPLTLIYVPMNDSNDSNQRQHEKIKHFGLCRHAFITIHSTFAAKYR